MKHVFLTTPLGREPGLTSVSLGLFRKFERLGVNVGFFKPFAQSHDHVSADASAQHIQEVSELQPPASLPINDLITNLAMGREDELMADVVSTVDDLLLKHDVVVVEGLQSTPQLQRAEKVNALLARTLNAEVVVAANAGERTDEELGSWLNQEVGSLPKEFKDVKPAVVINRYALGSTIDEEQGAGSDALLNDVRGKVSSPQYDLIGTVPVVPDLGATRMIDLIDSISAEVIQRGDIENRRVKNVRLFARQAENVLELYESGSLVILPSDRSDLILSTALAATKGIKLAGLILTSHIEIKQSVIDFCKEAFSQFGGLPILKVNMTSFEIATKFNNINTEVPVGDVERLNWVMDTVARSIDSDWLRQRCSQSIEKQLSPIAFKHRLAKLANQANKRILLPEGEEPRTVEAALECARRRIAKCILIGNPDKIQAMISGTGIKYPEEYLEILDPEPLREKYVAPLVELRKHKGVTEQTAADALADDIMLATMMIKQGDGDGLVAGAIHSTSHTIRPALRIIKTAPEAQVVSSIFFMCLPNQVMVYGDCAVNPDPNAEQLADIAIQSAQSAKKFGIEPRVAMISYSTLGSGAGADVEKVVEATRIAKEKAPELVIDGPLQYDAATIDSVARTKAPDSPVAGNANVIIFPDLNTGNTTYKAVQRSANVASIGPMLQGLNSPVNDLSRGALVEDIVYTIALTAIQASQ